MQKTHCMDQEDMKTFLRKEFSGLFSVRNIFSEELARSELEAMERDARFAVFYQDQQSKVAARITNFRAQTEL